VVKHGITELARSLLLHGAKGKVSHHTLQCQSNLKREAGEPVSFSRSAMVQLSADEENLVMVHLLLNGRADVSLEQKSNFRQLSGVQQQERFPPIVMRL
jgi:hypothetical protein